MHASDKVDDRERAERDESHVPQEKRTKRRADEIDRVGVEHVIEHARPQQQAHERSSAGEPQGSEQEGQSDGKIERVVGREARHEHAGRGGGDAERWCTIGNVQRSECEADRGHDCDQHRHHERRYIRERGGAGDRWLGRLLRTLSCRRH